MSEEERRFSEALQLPVAPADIRTAVLSDLQSIEQFVQRLTLDDWKTPSAVSEWTVGDVVTHLNLALSLYGRITDLVVAGRTGSGLLRKAGQFSKNVVPAAAPALNALNSAIPKVLDRALSPEVLKGQFAASARSLRDKVERIGPGDYPKPVYYMGGPWPLSFFLAAVDNELAIHGWDMASRLTTGAHLSIDARIVLPSFYWSATSWMFHPPKGAEGTVQAVLRDPNTVLWWTIRAAGVTTGRGTVENPTVTITGDCGAFSLLLSGRITLDDALRAGSMRTEGNGDLARQFLGNWRIV
jgi:uncharacterized protein (TIGR03083 family)